MMLHETRAYVCWEAKRIPEYEDSLAAVERWFRPTGTPALIAKFERLAALPNTTKSQHVLVVRPEAVGLDVDTVVTNPPPNLADEPHDRG
jgi:hypothetical protein